MRRRLLALVGGGVGVVWSFVYLALRHSLELVLLCFRSAQAKDVEILVLRHHHGRVHRRDLLGGLLREYRRAA